MLCAIILMAPAGCSNFLGLKKSETVQALKTTAKAMPETVDSLNRTANSLERVANSIDRDIVPPVAEAARTTSGLLRGLYWLLVFGAGGGLFSIAKSGWRLGRGVVRRWLKSRGGGKGRAATEPGGA